MFKPCLSGKPRLMQSQEVGVLNEGSKRTKLDLLFRQLISVLAFYKAIAYYNLVLILIS